MCQTRLTELNAELKAKMNDVFAATPARHSNETTWETWSPGWRDKLMRVSSLCRLEENDVPVAQPLHQPYLDLIQLHRLYTTLAVQFAQGTGPTSDRLAISLAHAGEEIQKL